MNQDFVFVLAATAAASQEATPGVPTSEFAFRPDLPDSDLDNDLPNCEMMPKPSGENLDLKHQISVISSHHLSVVLGGPDRSAHCADGES